MAGFGNLIGTFMQQAMTNSGGNRIGSALEHLQGANFGGATAGAGTGTGTGGAGLLGGLLGSVTQGLQGAANNPMQAGGLGALAGSLLGGGRGAVGGAVGGGALALLAGVAMQALQSKMGPAGAQGNSAPPASAPGLGAAPLGLREPENSQEEAALEETAKLLLKGMINAAKADGQVSPNEMQRIVDKLSAAGTDQELQMWVMQQMSEPLDLAAFAAEIPGPEVAAEVYAASLLAIEVDTDAERAYLQQLAAATGLHPLVTAQIQQTLGVTV
ncbi:MULTISPECIES: tellurite resistance TerB family protein [Thiorhodovibrio]|uniref:tellurite resistance TerB family protein n=1 Tax=Thiorhodovibrio TaxID=61593 RepID=UPI001913542E|nr:MULTISPECIES: tellurite resistance TerB family protein [Thiorhodovibrio]MBK5968042.1 hypothetical protein [Thiorhodovibrio winogradskyi]WPL11858.1 Inner membrane protein YebE [Thiorhodovibrio litoralis]